MLGKILFVCIALFAGVIHCAKRPHVVFFLMDDMGWNDVSWHNPDVRMPALEALAAEGLILDSNYVGPVCSPTRGSLMTGKYMYKIAMNHGKYDPDTPECLPLSEQTLAEKLKESGYATHIVGKWHLGYCDEACLPMSRGFDSQYGFFGSHIDHYKYIWGAPGIWEGYDWYDNQVYVNETGNGHENWAPELMSERAQLLISEHDPSEPMFLYFASGMVHFPIQTPPGYPQAESERDTFIQMIHYGDRQVGALVQALKQAGMYDDTVFIFSSDNGAQHGCGSNLPLRGWKSSIWEGGVRVPGLFHYPKMMTESLKGTKTEEIMYISDWFNTIVSMAGGETNTGLDSIDQTDMLLYGAPSNRNEFFYNLDNMYGQPYGQAAIRVGDYKLIVGYPGDTDGGLWGDAYGMTYKLDWWGVVGGRDHTDGVELDFVDGTTHIRRKKFMVPHEDLAIEKEYTQRVANRAILFNIREDPFETNDLAGDLPEVVSLLADKLKEAYSTMPDSIELTPDDASRDPKFHGVWTTGWCPDIANH